MINRKPPAHLGLLVWLLGLLCVGCSGTPFGEQLTERLSEPGDPVEETAAPNSAAVNTPTGEPLTEQPPESGDPVEEEEASPSNPTATPTAMGDPPTPDPPPPVNPTPYRLLLRLPAADPAAPAEAVTQALRAAGILFEVETIERLPNGPTSPSLAPSP